MENIVVIVKQIHHICGLLKDKLICYETDYVCHGCHTLAGFGSM